MQDGYGRKIDYMRISITDRCDLRCCYCMPTELKQIKSGAVLTDEEFLRICRISVSLGIENIKITGGEPLMRADCAELIKKIKKIEGIRNITLTTNGIHLIEHLQALKASGLNGINISLDTLDSDTYKEITGRNGLEKVIEGLEECVKAGIKTKVNCVPIRGKNDKELVELASLAKHFPVDIRFIELMPIGCGKEYTPIPSAEILGKIREKYPNFISIDEKRGFGPAVYYEEGTFQGKVGFITPMSHKFCERCNRIRLTSQGILKYCLCYEEGIDLKDLIRNGTSDEELKVVIRENMQKKPFEHTFAKKERGSLRKERANMSEIGG